MEKIFYYIHVACLLSSLLWNVKGAYYLKPTGRFEITEIPLPSSVIEQINGTNVSVTPNPGQINATGVRIVTVTRISNTSQVPKPAGSQQPCPTTPVCSCPCQKPPMSGKPPSLQPLPPKNDSINTWCTSVCICLCIGGSPVPIQPPTESTSKANVATLNLVVTSPLSNRITTAVPSSTPTIINKSRSTSITCPETAVCSTSETNLSSSRTSQSRLSVTLSPTLTQPMLPVQKGSQEN
ncbi:mucin-2-like isoform X1 [Pocillopora damicornis]|nr:mucin-2-like isoform X1 [Pocillopora damicornis]XP_027058833.1 mucin-2-like isoform X1 [Pocillopora damicornis]